MALMMIMTITTTLLRKMKIIIARFKFSNTRLDKGDTGDSIDAI